MIYNILAIGNIVNELNSKFSEDECGIFFFEVSPSDIYVVPTTEDADDEFLKVTAVKPELKFKEVDVTDIKKRLVSQPYHVIKGLRIITRLRH